MADQRILRGSAATLTVTLEDSDGVPAQAAGALTVGVTKDDGTVVVAALTATTSVGSGVYTAALTAAQTATLDILTAVWTDAGDSSTWTTTHEIVGGYFCSVTELRAMKNITNATKFTNAELIEARTSFEKLAERYCGQAFVPRYRRKRFSGDSTRSLYVDPNVRTIRRVRDYVDATTYTTYTADELADINANIDPAGWLHRTSGAGWRWGVRNLEIVYEHGMDACPDDLRLAAKNAIRHRLLDDETGHRAYAEQTDVGFLRFSRPGPNRPVGDDDIDTVLNGYKMIAVG